MPKQDNSIISPLSVTSEPIPPSNDNTNYYCDNVDNDNHDVPDSTSAATTTKTSANAGQTIPVDAAIRSSAEAVEQTPAISSRNENNNNENNNDNNSSKPVTKLYMSSRLKGYLTLALASFINYDAADKSQNVVSGSTVVVPALDYQRRYAMAVAVITLIISITLLVIHLDRITPFEKVWLAAFKAGSKIEMIIAVFLVIWWSIGIGLNTSVAGIAGDGKGQYNLYYSSWVCCLTSYWILERWWVAAGWVRYITTLQLFPHRKLRAYSHFLTFSFLPVCDWGVFFQSSLKSFISSWPHRSPAWILIMFLSFFTLIWYVDLRHNHQKLTQPSESLNYMYFENISKGQWQLLMIVTSFTFIPSTLFVLAEIFRDSNADGKIESKSKAELIVEGVCFLVITLMWIPTVMVATTPGGAASLIGNAYFFTWLLVVFVFEGVVWYIHDIRKEQHQALRMKEAEYRKRQQRVLSQTRAIQNQQLQEWDDRGIRRNESAHRLYQQVPKQNIIPAGSTEFFDAPQGE